jgi:hypothetical protein
VRRSTVTLGAASKKPGEFLFGGRRGRDRPIPTRQYARLVCQWIASIGLDPSIFGTHSLRRTKATLIYRRTGNLRAVQLVLGLEDAPGRAHTLGRIVVIDDIAHLALAAQRRRVLHQQRVFALVVQPLAHELPPTLLIDEARDGIGEVREVGGWVAGRRKAHRFDPGGPAAPQPGQGRVDAAG